MGQHLGAVRTDIPLERLSLLSRAVGAAEDQAFVREVRRDGAATVATRLPTIAQELTDTLRRLFEAPVEQRRPKRGSTTKKFTK